MISMIMIRMLMTMKMYPRLLLAPWHCHDHDYQDAIIIMIVKKKKKKFMIDDGYDDHDEKMVIIMMKMYPRLLLAPWHWSLKPEACWSAGCHHVMIMMRRSKLSS